jgi:hypothetical protein
MDAKQEDYTRRLVPMMLTQIKSTVNEVLASKQRYVELIRALERKAGQPSPARFHEYYESLRAALLRAVDASPLIGPELRREWRKSILGLSFFTPSELAAFDPQYFRRTCGKYGDQFGFFTDEAPLHGKTVISFCPGTAFLLGRGDPEAFLRSISFSLAHEMSHHIDSRSYRATYTSLMSCWARPSDQARGFSPNVLQAGEMTSDFWAGQAVAELIGTQKPEAKLAFVLNSLKIYCDSYEDYEHPDGANRLRVGFGRNEALNRILGCAADSEARPVCGL